MALFDSPKPNTPKTPTEPWAAVGGGGGGGGRYALDTPDHPLVQRRTQSQPRSPVGSKSVALDN